MKQRKKVLLICSECLSSNYSMEVRSDGKIVLEVRKFCPKCGKHTIHKVSR